MRSILTILSILPSIYSCAHYSSDQIHELKVAVVRDDYSAVSKLVTGKFQGHQSQLLIEIASDAKNDGVCRNPDILRTLLNAGGIPRCSALSTSSINECPQQTSVLLNAVDSTCIADTAWTLAAEYRKSAGDGLNRNQQTVFNLFKARLDSGCKLGVQGHCSGSKELERSLVDAKVAAANQKQVQKCEQLAETRRLNAEKDQERKETEGQIEDMKGAQDVYRDILNKAKKSSASHVIIGFSNGWFQFSGQSEKGCVEKLGGSYICTSSLACSVQTIQELVDGIKGSVATKPESWNAHVASTLNTENCLAAAYAQNYVLSPKSRLKGNQSLFALTVVLSPKQIELVNGYGAKFMAAHWIESGDRTFMRPTKPQQEEAVAAEGVESGSLCH